MTIRWTINPHKPNDVYQEELGNELRNIAVGLGNLGNSLNENLSRTATTISIPIYKILLDNPPLINCVYRPQLPPLRSPDMLDGYAHELFPPIYMSLCHHHKKREGLGTGIAIVLLGKIFQLHGLEYQDVNRAFSISPLWDNDAQLLSRDHWLKQELVELSDSKRQRISKVLKEVRNMRGAHIDLRWSKDFAQPLRDFYTMYVDLFVVRVGMLLLDIAVSSIEDETFRQHIFPKMDCPEDALKYSPVPSGVISVPYIALTSEPSIKNSYEFDKAKGLFNLPNSGHGTTGIAVSLFALGAPGWTTRSFSSAIGRQDQ